MIEGTDSTIAVTAGPGRRPPRVLDGPFAEAARRVIEEDPNAIVSRTESRITASDSEMVAQLRRFQQEQQQLLTWLSRLRDAREAQEAAEAERQAAPPEEDPMMYGLH